MNFIRYEHHGQAQIGAVEATAGKTPTQIQPWSVPTLAAALMGHGSAVGAPIEMSHVKLLPAMDDGAKCLCVALNYVDHAKEAKQAIPESPILFFKSREAIIAAGEAITPPPVVKQLDYEGELAIIIGQACFDISADKAWSVIAGVTAFNDTSSRDLLNVKAGEKNHLDWFSAKCIDRSSPVGPQAVPLRRLQKELQDQSLVVETRVNGEVRQHARMSDMIFDIPHIVAFASSRIRLSPGDVIATGTPPGVGFASGRYLKPGDVVEVEITGIPVLRNTIAA